MNTLEEWTREVCDELGLDPGDVDRDGILDMTKDVAHGVARPAAPLTAYVAGLAIGRGADPAATLARIAEMARARTPAED